MCWIIDINYRLAHLAISQKRPLQTEHCDGILHRWWVAVCWPPLALPAHTIQPWPQDAVQHFSCSRTSSVEKKSYIRHVKTHSFWPMACHLCAIQAYALTCRLDNTKRVKSQALNMLKHNQLMSTTHPSLQAYRIHNIHPGTCSAVFQMAIDEQLDFWL